MPITYPKRASAIIGTALRTIESVIRRHCELASPGARAGGVAFAQRFGGSINAHWHIHIVMTDGVYALDDHGALTFYQAVGTTISAAGQQASPIDDNSGYGSRLALAVQGYIGLHA